MLKNAVLSADGKILSVTVPLNFRKRGGRKLIIAPENANPSSPRGPTNVFSVI